MTKRDKPVPIYLGDEVMAHTAEDPDGPSIRLWLRHTNPPIEIYLNPKVWERLKKYAVKSGFEKKEAKVK